MYLTGTTVSERRTKFILSVAGMAAALVLVFLLGSDSLHAEAASVYDGGKAAAWALAYYKDDEKGGEWCATFVSKAMREGGAPVSVTDGCEVLRKQLKAIGFQENEVTPSSDGIHLYCTGANTGKISVGDALFYSSPKEGDVHTVIVTEIGSGGEVKVASRNRAYHSDRIAAFRNANKEKNWDKIYCLHHPQAYLQQALAAAAANRIEIAILPMWEGEGSYSFGAELYKNGRLIGDGILQENVSNGEPATASAWGEYHTTYEVKPYLKKDGVKYYYYGNKLQVSTGGPANTRTLADGIYYLKTRKAGASGETSSYEKGAAGEGQFWTLTHGENGSEDTITLTSGGDQYVTVWENVDVDDYANSSTGMQFDLKVTDDDTFTITIPEPGYTEMTFEKA